MIGISEADPRQWQGPRSEAATRSLAVLLAALSFLFAASPVQAHRLDADFKILADRRVRIESWFDLGGVPKGADVKVYGFGEKLLVEGQLDGDGFFVFPIAEVEPLKVIVSAGEGHRKEFVIPREALAGQSTQPREHGEAWRERLKDAFLGVSFLLALAAFILSLRNGRKLRGLRALPVEDKHTPPSDPTSS